MNVWGFTGHLGRDAETRTTQGGHTVTTFRVAVEYGRGERKGTLWVECALWGKRGDALAQHLTKGLKIAASGELSERHWKNQQGEDRSALIVNVNEIDFVLPKQAPEPPVDDSIPF